MKQEHLVIVPGMMGTALSYHGEAEDLSLREERVWSEDVTDLWRTLQTHPERLRPDCPLAVGNVIREFNLGGYAAREFYGKLVRRLRERGFKEEDGNITLFGYDWRQSLATSAEALKQLLQSLSSQNSARLVVIGHSMGGLVATLAVHDLDADASQRIRCVIRLGSPCLGASKAFRTLREGPRLASVFDAIRLLAEKQNPIVLARLLESLRTMPSLYELLPHDTETVLTTTSGRTSSAMANHLWSHATTVDISKVRTVQERIRHCSHVALRSIYAAKLQTEQFYLVDPSSFDIVKALEPFPYGDGTVTISSAADTTETTSRIALVSNVEHDELPLHDEVWETLCATGTV